MINKGLENEKSIMRTIHAKRLIELPIHLREGIEPMFKYHRPNQCVIANKVCNKIGCKTDIELSMYGQIINVSIKSGFTPSLHQEEFGSFIKFLKSLGISHETIQALNFYHHADESFDGTGIKTLRFDKFREKYRDMIQAASKELSQDHIVRAIAYRGIIKGRQPTHLEIDYLYYGTEDEGFFTHKDDILDYSSKVGFAFDHYTALHFGPFVYVAKIPNKRLENGHRLQYAQLIWPNIKEDLKKINELKKSAKYL